MKHKDYYTLADNIHQSLIEIRDMNSQLKQVDTMLENISKKIGHVDEFARQEAEKNKPD